MLLLLVAQDVLPDLTILVHSDLRKAAIQTKVTFALAMALLQKEAASLYAINPASVVMQHAVLEINLHVQVI